MPGLTEERYPQPFSYSANNLSTTGVQATVTVTGSTNIFTVVRDVTFSIIPAVAGVNISSANATMNVIDGATGGTNILWSGVVAVSSTGIYPLTVYLDRPSLIKGGNITAEFSAGITGAIQSVNIGYYTAK